MVGGGRGTTRAPPHSTYEYGFHRPQPSLKTPPLTFLSLVLPHLTHSPFSILHSPFPLSPVLHSDSGGALWNMKKQILDYTLVPAGLLLMVAYHFWLLFRILNHPNKTVVGVNSLNRRLWVSAMMEDGSKNGVLAVQTLRNNIMASTVLASTAIMLSSVIAVMMTGKNGDRSFGVVFGDKSTLGISIKYFAILVCFLLSFLLNVQSIRYYSHASVLINVPFTKMSLSPHSHHLAVEYVGTIVNKGSHFWSLGLRAFYFSFPLFLWIFGPIPMFLSCLVMVSMLYFLDVTFESSWPFWASELEENHPHNGQGGSLMV